uniref:Uncharacterized protein n=1 Tax=Arundo donax TaxID=35708 RepID=A0A0A9G965_ARUDO
MLILVLLHLLNTLTKYALNEMATYLAFHQKDTKH